MIFALALATVLVQPWHGKDLPTATSAAVKYRVTVKAAPGSTVRLDAADVASGWIGAFCDNRVCSPGHVSETIPASGTMMLQFELIREDAAAAHESGATIRTSDGQTIRVAPARV